MKTKKPQIMLLKVLTITYVITITLTTSNINANDLSKIKKETENITLNQDLKEKKICFFGALEYFSASNAGNNLSGPVAQFSVLYGLNELLGAGIGLRQGFSKDVSLLFTQIDLRIAYAITGSMLLENQSVSLGEKKIIQQFEKTDNRIQIIFHITQYNFNRTTTVTTFSGVGLSTTYDFSYGNKQFTTGIRIDKIYNGNISITPMQIFIGMPFWL